MTKESTLLDKLWGRRDPRVDTWPLMQSPLPTAMICLTYVLIVKIIGPSLMKNRSPFILKNTLILYNLFQVVFSSWLFYEYGRGGWFHGYSFTCQPVDYGDNPMALRMLNVCWWYYFSKFSEFFDTFFFILRKKTAHVSLLHVVHHGMMPMSVWFGVRFTPGGHSTFFGLLNTFVHILMYSYYMLAAMGYRIWWKKWLTGVQMVQFIMIALHSFQLLFYKNCDYPKAFVWWIGTHGLLFLVLFYGFYKDSYEEKKSVSIETEKVMQEKQQCNEPQFFQMQSKSTSKEKTI